MSLNTSPSASDSSENVDLTPRVGGVECGNNGFQELEKIKAVSREIIDLIKKLAKIALAATIHKQGGRQMVWDGLNMSGYNTFEELREDMERSVSMFFAKLTAKQNRDEGEISVRPIELEQAFHKILEAAFANHGIRLRARLDELKTHKTS